MSADADGGPFELLHRQMNELFDDFFHGSSLMRWPGLTSMDQLTPHVEVAETDDAYEVTAELPGLDEKDVEVTLDDNILTLKGEKTQEKEEKKKNYHFTERSYGHFERIIPLPHEVDKSKIKAHFKKGVLSLNLPKTEKTKKTSTKIQVSAE